jgi:hypothetical protein
MDEGNQKVSHVAAAIEASFKDAVADGAGMSFAETGVTSPKPELWARYARAAIEAMREPTDAMEAAVHSQYNAYEFNRMWTVAIDAALTPPPSGEM